MKTAVIGAGIRGSGIAQVSAMSGHEDAVVDVGEQELVRVSPSPSTSA